MSATALFKTFLISFAYKSRGDGNNVNFIVRAVLKRNTSLRELLNPVIFDIDYIDIRPVELLVVTVLEARTLHTEEMRHLLWSKNLHLPRILDSLASLSEPIVIPDLVRLGIDQAVLVYAHPVPEPAVSPDLVIEGLPLLRRVVKRILLAPVVMESGKALLSEQEELWVQRFTALLVLGG